MKDFLFCWLMSFIVGLLFVAFWIGCWLWVCAMDRWPVEAGTITVAVILVVVSFLIALAVRDRGDEQQEHEDRFLNYQQLCEQRKQEGKPLPLPPMLDRTQW
ncbi:hypothetical protein Plim_4273 (plasmid) [Planctopirus limnophila DSM 3776]|uniref:Uncharacterized protein n=1 Tax=Planctopirus limnophila (strain ATCC 43296 / DSM 3776 / IFAM 1008 / Mu 290) TaxID=521674 RepID=D5SZG0_PLAL2|nr:hypothetical protein Plim_4273 [Planctopirus limnophila DSM 3776]